MDEQPPRIETRPSLRGYLELYAAGFVDREEMLSEVAAWPFEPDDGSDRQDQDNTLAVVTAACALGQLTREDVEEIERRMDGPLF